LKRKEKEEKDTQREKQTNNPTNPKPHPTGQIRMDRDSDRGTAPQGWNYIDKGRCMEHIQAIWDTCGGYGGYINPSYGTVFMYCTETAGPMGEA
jgi:hypothetical protein